MNDHWTATKGLSVYNVLERVGDANPKQILTFLRNNWEPDLAPEYVAEGVEFLVDKGWARVGDDCQVHLLTRHSLALRHDDGDHDLKLVMKG